MYLVARYGGRIISRILGDGKPLDSVLINTGRTKLLNLLPIRLANVLENRLFNSRFDHRFYGLIPDHVAYPTGFAAINDILPSRILSGTVVMKPDIEKIYKKRVEFKDGSCEDNIDVIILATGYKIEFPFMPQELFEVKNGNIDLYKQIFVPGIQPVTAAVIGCIVPTSSTTPIFELQARCSLRVFKVRILIIFLFGLFQNKTAFNFLN